MQARLTALHLGVSSTNTESIGATVAVSIPPVASAMSCLAQISLTPAVPPPSPSTVNGTLTVLLLQPPLRTATEMVKQRRACADARSSCVWSTEQEKRLVQEVALTQQALAFVHLSTDESSS